MQTCHHNPSAADIDCINTTPQHLLQLLLMFVSYCVDILQKAPTSIPGILSALRYQLQTIRFVDGAPFDHPLLAAAKAGVARRPYEPKVKLPCTYAMVQHIIQHNTAGDFTLDSFMLATGVSMAYHLCLRASEYASKTKVPDPDSHQFDSQSVQFQCSDQPTLIDSCSMRRISWARVKLIKFTIQHAKNIRAGHGVPIWFTTDDADEGATAFLQLVYLWAHMSTRQPDDPFLSYRSPDGLLHCLLYTQVHSAITKCAADFGFNPKWFKPHSVRMAAPTALRAAGGSDGQILTLGRWKGVPTSLVYQGTSAKSNNRILRLIADSALFTSADILMSRILPPTRGKNRQATIRRF